MRIIVIAGLLLLAAFLPLAAVPVTIILVAPLVVVVASAPVFVSAGAQPVALLALTHFRAPPSR